MYNLKKSKILGEVQLTLTKLPIPELKHYGVTQHRRLKMFYEKGTTCVSCGRVGTKLLVNMVYGNTHVDIFTENDILMTVDHIIPLSKGGDRENINNLQPMCCTCNFKKGNKI